MKHENDDEGLEEIQYDKTSCVDQFILIAEVKKHLPLYNRHSPEYANNEVKDELWELIHAVLFPNYEELSIETKEVIRKTVRRRWKSLRDALVKDHRLRSEDQKYAEKKMSQAVSEMQYLTPHIKYPTRKRNETMDGSHSPDFYKLMHDGDATIDLTFQHEDSYVQVDDDMVSNEAFYPSIHLTTSEAESEQIQWKNGSSNLPATKQYNEGYTIREFEDPETKEEYEMLEQVVKVPKRKRTDSEDNLHSKLTDLIDRCNEESQDEDRMFLLSLLSDFKRVPIHKKLRVKSAFVTALYEALE